MLRDLGDGLILRRATPDDAERLSRFNAVIHSDDGPDQPDEGIRVWTRDLLEKPHPSFKPGDFTVVEDTRTGEIVSSTNLISQTWTYDGIPFGVGRPEVVGTHPDYRRRGLVRAQFEVLHLWSAERGEQVQAITGIPYYYRQFGYEMALELGGGRRGFRPQVPALKPGETEPYRVRRATTADIPILARAYAHGCRRDRIACVRDAAYWEYILCVQSATSAVHETLCIVESAAGEPVGILAHSPLLRNGTIFAFAFELLPGNSWAAATPSVLRYLGAAATEMAKGTDKPFEQFSFEFGSEHPVYDVFREKLPVVREPYAWYVRVADIPGFLRHVAPALERRLPGSVAEGHTGELKISFYRSGVRLRFESGRLAEVEPWRPDAAEDGDAFFPDLTFLQILFGFRSRDELRHAFPDCWTKSEPNRELVQVLFPKQTSDIWPIA